MLSQRTKVEKKNSFNFAAILCSMCPKPRFNPPSPLSYN